MNTSKLKILLVAGLAMVAQGLLVQELAAQKMTAQEQVAKELAIQELMAKELMAKQAAAEETAARQTAAKDTVAKEAAAKETVAQQPMTQKPVIPLTDPPQDLIGDDGKVELDLVDPFQRGSARATEERESEGLSSTSLGEISEEFRILAIIIPDDESRQPMALIRLQNESSPQVVMKDDLVQIKRRQPDRGAPVRVRPPATNAAQGQPAFAESALTALESYSFYLHIKDIQPTFIEAYQKKSPNETIILRW